MPWRVGSTPTTDTNKNKNKTQTEDYTMTMENTIMAIKNRIHLLEMRDPVRNNNIIKKLKRKLRKLEE